MRLCIDRGLPSRKRLLSLGLKSKNLTCANWHGLLSFQAQVAADLHANSRERLFHGRKTLFRALGALFRALGALFCAPGAPFCAPGALFGALGALICALS
jgi:hypothetical protein